MSSYYINNYGIFTKADFCILSECFEYGIIVHTGICFIAFAYSNCSINKRTRSRLLPFQNRTLI